MMLILIIIVLGGLVFDFNDTIFLIKVFCIN